MRRRLLLAGDRGRFPPVAGRGRRAPPPRLWAGKLTPHVLRHFCASQLANRHVLISRISALGTGPVSPDYLDKHQLRGISLEHIRRDRILQEALVTGADPLHLTLVFNIDHTNAMAYANAASNLLSSPAEQALSRRPE